MRRMSIIGAVVGLAGCWSTESVEVVGPFVRDVRATRSELVISNCEIRKRTVTTRTAMPLVLGIDDKSTTQTLENGGCSLQIVAKGGER